MFLAHKTENGLLLLEAHSEYRAPGLERVLKFLIQVQRGLDLNQGTELRTVVFDVNTAVLISTYVGVQSRN